MSQPVKGGYAILGIARQRFDWNSDFHKSSRVGIPNTQFAAKLLDPLPHAANANANSVGPAFRHSFRNSLAVVAHCSYDLTIFLHQGYPCFARSGMPEDVGYSFLHDAENCSLHLGRQPGKVGGLHLQLDIDAAALGESFQVTLKRRLQPDLIEQWGMQEIGNAAHLLNGVIDEVADLDRFILSIPRTGSA